MSQNLYKKAINAFDEYNFQDPNLLEYKGKKMPKEWVDAQRLHEWVKKLNPQASEP